MIFKMGERHAQVALDEEQTVFGPDLQVPGINIRLCEVK